MVSDDSNDDSDGQSYMDMNSNLESLGTEQDNCDPVKDGKCANTISVGII